MAAMSTALQLIEISGGKFTYTTSGHTVLKPKVVVGIHKAPTGRQVMSDFTVVVSHATEDADGAVLAEKSAITVTARQSIHGQATDMTAVLAIVKDIVNSDEFANSLVTGEPLQ